MAKKTVAAPAQTDAQADRDLNTEVNAAIAATEMEIFEDALGDEPLDLDGDRSLEEMDSLEDEVVDEVVDEEEDAEAEAEPEGEEDEDEEADDAEESEEDDEAEEAEDAEEDEPEAEERPRGRAEAEDEPRGRVPPSVLRKSNERARQAEDRARQTEQEAQAWREQFLTLQASINDTNARVNALAAPKPVVAEETRPAKPDMFADPEGYERWMFDEAERRAEAKADAKIEARFSSFSQQQQEQAAVRVNDSLSAAAKGERGFEFHPAFQAFTSLDPKRPEVQKLARQIYSAADAGAALFEWWDANGGEEYREQLRTRLLGGREEQERDDPPRRARRDLDDSREGRRGERDERPRTPRHEVRLPNSVRSKQPPSLNEVRGAQRQQFADPEMLDGSEASIADYAFRR